MRIQQPLGALVLLEGHPAHIKLDPEASLALWLARCRMNCVVSTKRLAQLSRQAVSLLDK